MHPPNLVRVSQPLYLDRGRGGALIFERTAKLGDASNASRKILPHGVAVAQTEASIIQLSHAALKPVRRMPFDIPVSTRLEIFRLARHQAAAVIAGGRVEIF
jgi:hypothetical protein